MSRFHALAAAAVLGPWGMAALAAAPANGVIWNSCRHAAPPAPVVEKEFRKASGKSRSTNSLSCDDAGPADATASFNMRTGTILLLAAAAGPNQVTNSGLASAMMGEVLDFFVDGADASTRTTLTLTVQYSGGGRSDEQPVSQTIYQICIPDDVTCPQPAFFPDSDFANLELPSPLNVEAFYPVGFVLDEYSPTVRKGLLHFVIRGPHAVVPLLTEAYGWVFSPTSRSIDSRFSWSIKLPPGVTCRSRSGVANNGKCPALAG